MNRIVLFLAFATVSASAMSVHEHDAHAFNVGKKFLDTLKDLTAESDYSVVQRKLTNENPEMRDTLSKAFIKSANGESQLNMREVVNAFEEVSRKNNLSPDRVLKVISDDPLYKQVGEQLAKVTLFNEEEQIHPFAYQKRRFYP